jgi:hypothetical protein
MTFVYEPIPAADLERIDIVQISHKFHKTISAPGYWVVDREVDAFLFGGYRLDREIPHPKTYFFVWKNKIFDLEVLEEDGPRNEQAQRTMNLTVRYIAGTEFDMEVEENPVFTDHVKDALRAVCQGLADRTPWGTQIAPVVFQKFETLQDYYHDNNRRAG